jgi:hypothetical protein
MKVIDLLNKIANGEEVPTRIKYKNDFYEYAECYQDYRNETKTDDEDYEILLLSHLIDKQVGTSFLNYEIEIIEEDIEEDKPIEKIEINYARDIEEKIFYEESDKPNHCILGDAGTELLINKINEIIDEVNKLKKEKENE